MAAVGCKGDGTKTNIHVVFFFPFFLIVVFERFLNEAFKEVFE